MSAQGIESMEAKRRRGEKSATSEGAIPLEVLDCAFCFDPLRPPVFQNVEVNPLGPGDILFLPSKGDNMRHLSSQSVLQVILSNFSKCRVGHVICSSCHHKLRKKDNCHVCAITGGYNRCIAFDHILESIKVSCSNSIYGCTIKTHYYQQEEHEKSCPHAPCFCPEPGCGFAGSTAQLQRHLTVDHMLPATAFAYGYSFTLHMQEGMRVLHRKEEGGPLFLAKFTLVPPFGNAISILCIHPHVVTENHRFECDVDFYSRTMGWHQHSNFQIISTNLSNGFPGEEASYTFVVPKISSDPHTTTTRLLIRPPKITCP
ncbi:Putative E3 ubiquitin-protein ligase SINA-like 6 [Triticum urartu]|uniref:SIAH-type domain-containing protein n=2 Tax=Triticum TaxID=4564 RepID=A0A9R0VEL2_TRITD|nr:Putative E3 ubiquitin-protein ligase SINA-like 6 [Triticum urartu]VAH56227.1 unnamed protein product [Triticum turgidum subsp. durum]